jgi:hypothetical protein
MIAEFSPTLSWMVPMLVADFDWSQTLRAALIGGVIGGVVGPVMWIVRRNKPPDDQPR